MLSTAIVLLSIGLPTVPVTISTRMGPAPILDPRSYGSPSSRYRLEVDPSHPQGRGPARYRLLREGEEVWSAEHPFTFWDAVVADDGTSIGFAYPLGIYGTSNQEGFTVAILDVAGRVRARHGWKRSQHGAEGPWRPSATGLFLDADPSRFVLRVQTEPQRASPESWWRFRISDGEEVAKLDPERALNALRDGVRVHFAQAVPGTPLVLVHGLRLDDSAVFALLDESAVAVWLRDVGGDGGTPAGVGTNDRMRRWARDGGAMLTGPEPGRFAIRSVARGVRTRFEATRDPASKGAWRVRELDVEDAPIDFAEPAEPQLPRVELREVGRATLGTDEFLREEVTRPMPRIIDETFVDRAGRILALDRPWRLLQVFDREGAEIARGRFTAADELKPRLWTRFAETGGGDVLVGVGDGEYVRFDKQATYLGRENPTSEIRSKALAFQPGSEQRWIISRFGDSIVDGGKGPGTAGVRPTIRRRPDGRWLRNVHHILVTEDGTLFANDASSSDLEETPCALCIYPSDGSVGQTRELPVNSYDRIVAAGPAWLVVAGGDRVTLIERGGDRMFRADFEAPEAKANAISWYGSPDGRELWRIEGTTRTLVRFALP